MCLRECVPVLVTACLISCATPGPQPASLHVATDGLLTQRAVLTIHGRQFSLNGYLALSEKYGMRLIVTHSLGQVMADVLVKPDGSVYVLRRSPMLRVEWIKRYVGRDAKCLFGNIGGQCPGRALDATHFVVTDRNYAMDLRTVDTKPGVLPPELFDETEAPMRR